MKKNQLEQRSYNFEIRAETDEQGKVITVTHNGMSSKSNSTMDLTLPMIPITS